MHKITEKRNQYNATGMEMSRVRSELAKLSSGNADAEEADAEVARKHREIEEVREEINRLRVDRKAADEEADRAKVELEDRAAAVAADSGLGALQDR